MTRVSAALLLVIHTNHRSAAGMRHRKLTRAAPFVTHTSGPGEWCNAVRRSIVGRQSLKTATRGFTPDTIGMLRSRFLVSPSYVPIRPQRACAGCRQPANGRYCPRCAAKQAEVERQRDARRASPAARLYDSRWDKARRSYLASHPLCAYCAEQGRTEAANTVDHFIPHKGDQRLFWDTNNWRSSCKSCHDAKTAREDGGFGNRRRRRA